LHSVQNKSHAGFACVAFCYSDELQYAIHPRTTSNLGYRIMSSFTIKYIAACAAFVPTIALFSVQALAQTAADVKIEGAWVRATVEGQKGTGGFMKLTAPANMKLLAVASPAAGVGEVHEMKMEGSVMRMAEVKGGLDLPAGKAVELKPGGFHIMLLDLKQALKVNSQVPVTLTFANAKGEQSKVELKMPVSMRAPGSAPGKDMSGHGAHKH
jgi:periplasmic copper chaperone A